MQRKAFCSFVPAFLQVAPLAAITAAAIVALNIKLLFDFVTGGS